MAGAQEQAAVPATDMGNPDAVPAAPETVTATTSLPKDNPPVSHEKDPLGGDLVIAAGLIIAIVIAFLVYASVLKSGVSAMKHYDEAQKSALIAALLTGFVVAAIAVGVGQFVLKG